MCMSLICFNVSPIWEAIKIYIYNELRNQQVTIVNNLLLELKASICIYTFKDIRKQEFKNKYNVRLTVFLEHHWFLGVTGCLTASKSNIRAYNQVEGFLINFYLH